MLISDWILFAALVAIALILILPNVARKSLLVLVAALIATGAGAASYLQGMWQTVPALGLAVLCVLGAVAVLVLARGKPAGATSRPWLAVLVGVGAIAVAVPYYLFPIPVLPAPTGPYAVGTVAFELTDPSRRGVLEDAPDQARRIQVRAWYPASDAANVPTRPYFTAWESDNTARAWAANWGFPAFSFSHLRHIRTHAHENAPLAEARGGRPVVIYSHGYWGWAGQNTALMEELASRGYIVFSLAHPHDAGDMQFADGEIVRTIPPDADFVMGPGMTGFWNSPDHDARWAAFPLFKQEFDAHRIMQSFAAWLADGRFLLDALRGGQAPEPAGALAAGADFSRLAFAGMSFGGTMAASLCERELSCKAAVNLDGEEFDWTLYDHSIRMPLLMLHSDWPRYALEYFPEADPGVNQNDYAYERLAETGLNPQIFRLRVQGLRHAGLSDLILGARMPASEPHLGEIDGREAALIMNDFTADFLDQFVMDRAADFPDAQLRAHPAVVRHDASGVRRWRLARSQPTAQP